jgi:hypothetical protein
MSGHALLSMWRWGFLIREYTLQALSVRGTSAACSGSGICQMFHARGYNRFIEPFLNILRHFVTQHSSSHVFVEPKIYPRRRFVPCQQWSRVRLPTTDTRTNPLCSCSSGSTFACSLVRWTCSRYGVMRSHTALVYANHPGESPYR